MHHLVHNKFQVTWNFNRFSAMETTSNGKEPIKRQIPHQHLTNHYS